MKKFAIGIFEIAASIGFILVIAASAIGGYHRALFMWEFGGGEPLLGLVFGGLLGAVVASILFGAAFLLIDLADNTRRIRELLEEEARSKPAMAKPA